MAIPAKPSEFLLSPGKGLLKGQAPLANTGQQGMQDEDVNKCEEWAWGEILSIFGGMYDISFWDTDPPIPLPQLWELLASAMYLRFVVKLFAASKQENDIPTMWGQDADKLVRGLLPGKQQRGEVRRYFIRTDSANSGEKLWPSKDYVNRIYVITPAEVFFPAYDTDKSHGMTSKFSFEDFFKDNTVQA